MSRIKISSRFADSFSQPTIFDQADCQRNYARDIAGNRERNCARIVPERFAESARRCNRGNPMRKRSHQRSAAAARPIRVRLNHKIARLQVQRDSFAREGAGRKRAPFQFRVVAGEIGYEFISASAYQERRNIRPPTEKLCEYWRKLLTGLLAIGSKVADDYLARARCLTPSNCSDRFRIVNEWDGRRYRQPLHGRAAKPVVAPEHRLPCGDRYVDDAARCKQ